MFTEHELQEYMPFFNRLNINEEDQLSILEFFYAIGTLVYNTHN